MSRPGYRSKDPAHDTQTQEPRPLTRAEACKRLIGDLNTYTIGNRGRILALEHRRKETQSTPSFKVEEFLKIGETTCFQRLIAKENEEAARNEALSVIAQLIEAEKEKLFISHICEMPKASRLAEGADPILAGQISVVYSLIAQMLVLVVQDDKFVVKETVVKTLFGTEESWQASLVLLKQLVKCTPNIRYCIVDGVQRLERTGIEEREAADVRRYRELILALSFSPRDDRSSCSTLFTVSGTKGALDNIID
ncbi:hypothetical protein BDV96DRAFT_237100 [Lophiotrema nucula]|uniref:Uncharacterized protein n=1 Tax=Lophiotrema nucula TaxID=690887 RepID=A0A6A5YSN3_9PLEO|nr:hypothetical protein BDV96DRAFT_237100 [Lophiotrema nucula]